MRSYTQLLGESRPRAASTGLGDQVANNAGREIENLEHVPARYLLAHCGVGVGEPEAAREIKRERERKRELYESRCHSGVGVGKPQAAEP